MTKFQRGVCILIWQKQVPTGKKQKKTKKKPKKLKRLIQIEWMNL